MSKFFCVIFLMLLIMSSALFPRNSAASLLNEDGEFLYGVVESVPAVSLSVVFPNHDVKSIEKSGKVLEEVILENDNGKLSKIIDILGVNIISRNCEDGVVRIFGYSKLLSANNIEIIASRPSIVIRVER